MSNDEQMEEMIITIAERAGIELDTPNMERYFALVADTEGMQEFMDKVVSTVIMKTVQYQKEFVPTTGEPDVERPNVVIEAVVANQHEYGGMDMSINLRQKRIWTGFDLMEYDNAEEFLDGVLHMLSWAAPTLTLKEEEGSDWTDADLQWGEQYDGEKHD